MDKSLCLLITRCVVKALALVCMIAGIAAAQIVAEVSTVKVLFMLSSVRVTVGEITITASLGRLTDEIGCGNLAHMFYSAFAMGIIAIFCAVAGIVMGLINKFVGDKIPSVAFVAVAGLATVGSLIGLALIIAAINGEACDVLDIRTTSEAKYDGGFAMYIIACFFILCDLVVEMLAMAGLVGGPSDATKSSSADEEAKKDDLEDTTKNSPIQ